MVRLSHDQFASVVNDEGGASRKLSNSVQVRDDDPANKGFFAVSYPKRHGLEDKLEPPVTRKQVADHRQRMLADPTVSSEKTTMQGGWQSGEKVYLDASRMVAGKSSALGQARADQQKGMQDMSAGKTVYTRPGYARADLPKPQKVVGTRSSGFTIEDQKPPKRSASRAPSVSATGRVAGRRRS